ncbi:MAG: DUF5684 domain-containing protein [Lachnospiraceae bacterium]|nr:DUF5684 domain-containing protein [Lachnospiraceae bacterium]
MNAIEGYSNSVQRLIAMLTTGVGITFSLVILVLSIVAMWKIFTKAGVEGWKSIIPIYNIYILTKISFGNGWWFLLLLIPCVSWIFAIVLWYKLSTAFGHGIGFTLGLIFFNTIFILIIGLGDSQYVGYNSNDSFPN